MRDMEIDVYRNCTIVRGIGVNIRLQYFERKITKKVPTDPAYVADGC